MNNSTHNSRSMQGTAPKPQCIAQGKGHTNSPYSQGWHKHASGRSHPIGPHHEGEGEEEEAGQGPEVEEEVCPLWQRLAKVDDEAQTLRKGGEEDLHSVAMQTLSAPDGYTMTDVCINTW